MDKLLEYIDTNPRIVALSLFAIIIVGGVGGGIWINSLKDSLSYTQSTNDNKIESMERDLTSMKARISKLNKDNLYYTSNSFQEIITTTTAVKTYTEKIKSLSNSKSKTGQEVLSNIEQIEKTIASLERKIDSVEKHLAKTYNYSDSMFGSNTISIKLPVYNKILIGMIIFLGILYLLLAILLIRRKK